MQLQTTQNLQQAIHYIQALPPTRQQQIFNFIDMVRLYENEMGSQMSLDQTPTPSKKDAGVFSDVFGMVKARKSASLEEMDEAVRRRGAGR